MIAPSAALSRSEDTKTALIEAAMRLFGRKGYAGASTREIAAAAGANVASIAYHFGGKDGLRRACVHAAATYVDQTLAPLLTETPPSGRDEAMRKLEEIGRAMADALLTQPESPLIVNFLLREMMAPEGAVDEIYESFYHPTHSRICTLWGAATGADPESDGTKLAVFALFGQMLYFRISEPMVKRRMGWRRIGPKESERVADSLIGNLRRMAAPGEATI